MGCPYIERVSRFAFRSKRAVKRIMKKIFYFQRLIAVETSAVPIKIASKISVMQIAFSEALHSIVGVETVYDDESRFP